jgi:hypothetical protein
LTIEEQQKIIGATVILRTLAEDIEAVKVLIEDLPKKELERLRRLLASGA